MKQNDLKYLALVLAKLKEAISIKGLTETYNSMAGISYENKIAFLKAVVPCNASGRILPILLPDNSFGRLDLNHKQILQPNALMALALVLSDTNNPFSISQGYEYQVKIGNDLVLLSSETGYTITEPKPLI